MYNARPRGFLIRIPSIFENSIFSNKTYADIKNDGKKQDSRVYSSFVDFFSSDQIMHMIVLTFCDLSVYKFEGVKRSSALLIYVVRYSRGTFRFTLASCCKLALTR